MSALPAESKWAPAVAPKRGLWQGADRHVLLAVTVIALPFSYIPLELVPGRVSVTIVVFALVVLTGIRYRVLRQRPGALETVTLLLSAYIFIRLTAVTALQADVIDWQEALSATLAPLGGVILYRVARRDDLKEPCLRALRWMFVMLTAIALYQAVVGLAFLQSRGYTEGFYYFTFAGTYRPFGTFLSPTVFGAFLAIVGAALVCMAPTIRGALLWFAIALAPILLTETRAAWISFGIAVVVGWLLRTRARPVHLTLGLAAITWAIAFVVWLAPGAVDFLLSRLATLSDSGLTSNAARVNLWQGTLETTLAESPLVGFPTGDFSQVVGTVAGAYADYGHAHSNYLQVLFLYGLIGLALFAGILVLATVGALRTASTTRSPWAYGGVAAIVAFLIDSSFETSWTSFSIVAVLYLLLGLGQVAGVDRGLPSSPAALTVPKPSLAPSGPTA
ncbi:O-antigen ligase family protein [Agrococcus beijingensis]|uniref:O-antigen ligase family protein n=1 Tax=Agrococcus beijingensis TaxID=3068634 RepID=UPI0027425CE1|nr:O-antigen ligase family protein [Agrococcus sp. REN33]